MTLTLSTITQDLTAAFWCLAAIATLANLSQRLPLQNVLASAAIVGGSGLAMAVVGAGWTGIFSSVARLPTDVLQPRDPRWCFPFFWTAAVLNSRAVSRLVLRSWPRRTCPGYWTLGLASVLVAAMTVSGMYSITAGAPPIRGSITGLGGSASYPFGLLALGWTLSALITLVLNTTWLIDKRLVSEAADIRALVIWLLLNLCLVAGLALRHLPFAAGCHLVLTTVVSACAVGGARQWNPAGSGSPATMSVKRKSQ